MCNSESLTNNPRYLRLYGVYNKIHMATSPKKAHPCFVDSKQE